MAAKNVILRKKIENVLYNLLPQTSFAQVINGESQTLETVVANLSSQITAAATKTELSALQTKFDNLIEDAPAAYDTLKEIGDYIATHQDEYTALQALVGNKVTKEEGKGLSTNDFTDELKTKLEELYDKTTLDGKISTLQRGIDTNTQAIAKLNADENTEGSVDYKIKQKITEVTGNIDDVVEDVAANTTAIEAINNPDTGILKQAKDYTDTKVTTETAKKGAVYFSATEPETLGDLDLWIYDQTPQA